MVHAYRAERFPTIETPKNAPLLFFTHSKPFPFYSVEKYGTDDKMNLSAFELWWKSTYTTYNEDALSKMVDEIENTPSLLDTIPETPDVPHNSNIAVSRS